MKGENSMAWNHCYKCKTQMWIPDALNEAAKARRGPSGIHFWCPYGHDQHYVEGESDETKLRRERDRLLQRIAERDDEIKALENRRRAAVGQVTKLKNRVGNGVCPCCNRTFENLHRHMATQHPTFTAEAAE